ncbi:hypothetical protein BG004_003864 [Podila humilis]|nr:hypothetical protein BG004_003864 [Podila humilis]
MSDSHSASSSETVATLKLLLIGSSGTGKSSLLMRFVDGVFLAPDEISATIGVDFKVKVIDVEGKKYKLTIWVADTKKHHDDEHYHRTPPDRSDSAPLLLHTTEVPKASFLVMSWAFLLVHCAVVNCIREKLTCPCFYLLLSLAPAWFFAVYDVSNRDSFNDLQTWFNELDTYCSSKEVVRMIVGNKVDKVVYFVMLPTPSHSFPPSFHARISKESSREVSRQEGQDFARKLQTLFVECSAKTKLGVQQAFDELVQQIIDTPSLWQKQAAPNVRLQTNTEASQEYGGCAC